MIIHPEIDAAASKKQKKLEHIAFIMDGDGRWATKRGMPREYGHTVGAKVFRRVAEYCFRGGINTVTVYAFSTENWKRPAREVNALMTLFTTYLKTGMAEMMKDDIRIRFLGEKTPFGDAQRRLMEKIESDSAGNKYNLNIAVNYGGRREIALAFEKLHEKLQNGEISGRITEEMISDELFTAGQPDPDLIVRTSGEMRLSNFLTWQSVYSELYFTDVLWPDINEEEVDKAVADYYSRQRRYGGL
ncbi:MAG: polyprenyl diphosphate synthase [Eubacteriales bacterium]